MSPLHAPQRLATATAAWLRITHGTAWVTVEGERADHVLCRGQGLALARGAVAWIGPWEGHAPTPQWRLQPAMAPQGQPAACAARAQE